MGDPQAMRRLALRSFYEYHYQVLFFFTHVGCLPHVWPLYCWMLYGFLDVTTFIEVVSVTSGDKNVWKGLLTIGDNAQTNRLVYRYLISEVESYERLLLVTAPFWAHNISNATKWSVDSACAFSFNKPPTFNVVYVG